MLPTVGLRAGRSFSLADAKRRNCNRVRSDNVRVPTQLVCGLEGGRGTQPGSHAEIASLDEIAVAHADVEASDAIGKLVVLT